MNLTKEEQDQLISGEMNEVEQEIAENMNWFLERIFQWPAGRMQMRVKMVGQNPDGKPKACALTYEATPPLSDEEVIAAKDAISSMTEQLTTLKGILESQGLEMGVDFSPEGAAEGNVTAREMGGIAAARVSIRGVDGKNIEDVLERLGIKGVPNKKDLN